MSISFNPHTNVQEYDKQNNSNYADNTNTDTQINIFSGETEKNTYSTNNIEQDLENSSTAALLGVNLSGKSQNVQNANTEAATEKTADTLKKELDEIETRLLAKQKEYDEIAELTEIKKEEAEEAIEQANKKKSELDNLNAKIKEKQKAYESAVEMAKKDPDNAGYKTQIDQKKSELDGLSFLLVKEQIEYDTRLNASIEKQKEFNELKKQMHEEEIELDALNESYSKKETAYNEAVENEALEAAAQEETEVPAEGEAEQQA